jgi:hypothetical protein
MTLVSDARRMLAVKPVGEPDAGNPHVRFDQRGGETDCLCGTAPFLDSAVTLPSPTSKHAPARSAEQALCRATQAEAAAPSSVLTKPFTATRRTTATSGAPPAASGAKTAAVGATSSAEKLGFGPAEGAG